VAGGGQTEVAGEIEFRDVEFYSPPYLFNGPRPVINSAPAVISYGEPFVIGTDETKISQIVLIRLPSVTHGFNQSQAFCRLEPVKGRKTKGELAVYGPSNPNIAPPGHYMLFILNNKGVPAVARVVKLQ
jgi:hypothetical protein